MTWRSPAVGFGLRLLLCLLLVGGSYGGYQLIKAKAAPASPERKQAAALRGNLQENLLRGTTLANFTRNDATTDDTLQRLVLELENSTASVQKAAQSDTNLTPLQRQSISRVTSLQKQAINLFRSAHTTLGKVVGYNPSTDLGNLDPAKDRELLTGRAAAAYRGLTGVAGSTATTASVSSSLSVGDENGPSPLVSPATKQALTTAAGCYQTLSTLTDAKQLSAQRSSCIAAFPAVRRQALTNLLQDSFSQQYQAQLKQLIEPLLKQLDQQLRS